MSEVLDRQAVYDTMRADSAPATAAPRAGFGDEALHRVVVVGGGAAGLELVTRLGDETDIGCRVEVSSTADRSARSKAKLKSM
jgi:NADH dehydrogenase